MKTDKTQETQSGTQLRIIVSGGGTAGHIYPAISVAQQLRERGHNVLFIGAEGKMEMERVPKAGFEIIALPIVGLQRKFTLQNFALPFKLIASMNKANRIINTFKPDVVVGFGGYASGPILKAAQRNNVPTVLQEQNSYAGLTNKILAKKAKVICTAYSGMEQFFNKDRIVMTGNPLRINPHMDKNLREEAIKYFGLESSRKTIFVTGGSLGTRTLNEFMVSELGKGCNEGKSNDIANDIANDIDKIQIIWQNGSLYDAEMERRTAELGDTRVKYVRKAFIERMDLAYAAADLIICRAGASTVSELQLLGKASIFVPSPNVSGDHQTKNAASMVKAGAAKMIQDNKAVKELMAMALELVLDNDAIHILEHHIGAMSRPYAASDVAKIVEGVARKDENFAQINRVFFLGIGGIGMSALARFFAYKYYHVSGYDLTRTPLTQAIENEGVTVHYEDKVCNIPHEFLDKNNTTVIYTPAIPKASSELNYFISNGFSVQKRSSALGMLVNDMYLQAVAGTHGKTTTSTMVAHINTVASGEGSAFLGGIAKNFGSNLVLGHGDRVVVEADEFDRSFHALTPNAALITSADPDHLDIYGTKEEFRESFEHFISLIKKNGVVIIKKGVELTVNRSDIEVLSYDISDTDADYYGKNIELLEGGYYRFDIVTPTRVLEGCELGIVGHLNVMNAIGAVALVDVKGFDDMKIKEALKSYEGVARRFDMHVNTDKMVYMDDYAHHPDELTAMLNSARKMFPGRRITLVFQPHLFTRTNDFADGFSKALSLADKCILLPIYPARELPIEGVDSKMLMEKITCEKIVVHKEDIETYLKSEPIDVLITAGAGNIDQHRVAIADMIKAKLLQKD